MSLWTLLLLLGVLGCGIGLATLGWLFWLWLTSILWPLGPEWLVHPSWLPFVIAALACTFALRYVFQSR